MQGLRVGLERSRIRNDDVLVFYGYENGVAKGIVNHQVRVTADIDNLHLAVDLMANQR